MTHVIAYLRVSQGNKDVEKQKFVIIEYASQLDLTNITFVQDVVSSRTHWKGRKIGEVVSNLNYGDILIAAETTRLGKNALEVLEIQQEVLARSAILHIVKENIVIGNLGQTENERILQKITVDFLNNMSRVERAFTSKYTKDALEKKKAEGVKLGRPKGSESVWMLDYHYKQVFELMKKGIAVPQILKVIADEGEKPLTNQIFYLWIRKWGIEPIGFFSKADERSIQKYFDQIEAARPKIKAFLEKHDKKSRTT